MFATHRALEMNDLANAEAMMEPDSVYHSELG
jgi:hypothetical protein